MSCMDCQVVLLQMYGDTLIATQASLSLHTKHTFHKQQFLAFGQQGVCIM